MPLLVVVALIAAVPSAEPVETRVGAAVEALLRAQDTRLFPSDGRVVRVERKGSVTQVYAEGTWTVSVDEVTAELRRESLMGALDAAGVDDGVELLVRDARGAFVPLLPRIPDVERPRTTPSKRPFPGDVRSGRLPFGGALVGRRIALSAGHGWLSDGNGGWGTQRSRWDFSGCGNCRGITEDFFTSELVTRHVIPMLENMGAEVVLVREHDHSRDGPQVVDDGAAGHTEQGGWSAASGAGYGSGYRTLPSGASGEARFAMRSTEEGERRVTVRYVEGNDRTDDAVVTIAHAGGTSVRHLDQRLMGRQWLDLGSFWFVPGQGDVVISPGVTSGTIVADAVKIGGGVHAASQKPWWQMGAVSYVPYAGADANVLQYGDVSIRPAYAEFVGADAYVSIHANASGQAGGSSANGISTYRYSCQAYSDHSSSAAATGCDDPPRSTELESVVHGRILARLRSGWDANYGDRGTRVANFGELRTLDDTPGILIETGFFDNLASPSGSPPPRYPDNRSLHDPRWREAFTYGLAEGLALFFSSSAAAPPARPEGLRAINRSDGTLAVSWRATPGAQAYRLYRASRGRAWNDGEVVDGTEVVLEDLEPYGVYAFRVAALDAHGEGMVSQAVSARFRGAVTTGAAAEALILYAYDRRDAWVQEIDNDFAHAMEHGRALGGVEARDVFFDGVLDEAVEDGTVALGGYALVDYVAGKDSTSDKPVSKPMQGLLSQFVDGGGALVLSGEEVGYALVETSSDPDDLAFMTNVLGAVYVSDDAETFGLAGQAELASVGSVTLDDGSQGVYEVVYPDVLSPAAGATTLMTYPDGTTAAVAKGRVAFFGAPLEAVVPESSRINIFAALLAWLLPNAGNGDLDGDGASDACELAHGLLWRDASDGSGDADGDGASNAMECRSGTNPTVDESGTGAGDAAVTTDAALSVDGGADSGTPVGDDGGAPRDAAVARPDSGATPLDAAATYPDASAVAADAGSSHVGEPEPQGPFPLGGCGDNSAGSAPRPAPLALLALLAAALVRRRRGAGTRT